MLRISVAFRKLFTLGNAFNPLVVVSATADRRGREGSGDPAETVLTTEQVAELLHLDSATVARKAKAGELPGKKVGKRWLFRKDVILDWLADDA